MKKVKIELEQKLTYSEEMVVGVPDYLSANDLSILVEGILQNRPDVSPKDVAYILENEYELKIDKQSFNFPEQSSDSETEVFNVYDVK
ncbi:hypothetical protein CHH91_04560 [Virgibacillus sp. 7505]|uniref:hypothetical protein n=1 Tax=Virgibacillus sp. 7505 TaxID=2022548 RepID=UPI000BA5203F|nr:hypothetical protein [Virgibacillus sp. 7505]PAE17282.1 hypothetical protein CHH91_04560 [Virgibacillus sp. 7505]